MTTEKKPDDLAAPAAPEPAPVVKAVKPAKAEKAAKPVKAEKPAKAPAAPKAAKAEKPVKAPAAPKAPKPAKPTAEAVVVEKAAEKQDKKDKKDKKKAKKKDKKNKEAVIIRFDDAQLPLIDGRAETLGLSRAAWVRMVVAQALAKG